MKPTSTIGINPQPLKGKRKEACEHCYNWIEEEDIRAAVEWFLSEINNIPHGQPKRARKLKHIHKDSIRRLIKSAFEDVMV